MGTGYQNKGSEGDGGDAAKSTRRTIGGTTGTILASDNQNFIDFTNNTANTLFVPSGLQSGLAVDEIFGAGIRALGNGAITLTGSGATFSNINGHTKIKAGGNGWLLSIGTNAYRFGGDTE